MLKRTALFMEHQRLGARIIDFGGWELPVQYSGLMDEHTTCRTAAGLFDVSHMGEITLDGSDAEKYLNYLVTNDVTRLAIGQAMYTAMCNVSGGIVDDLVIYRRAKTRFLLCVNASNTEKDFNHMQSVKTDFRTQKMDLSITNESNKFSQISIQGPRSQQIVQSICDAPLADLKRYWFLEAHALQKIPTLFARTGYTGEDGFELYLPWETGPAVWRALLEVGTPLGLKPCGLGARDTLRLEMKYALYGQELTEETNPLEAGLGWVVKMEKEDFVGKTSLSRILEKGIRRHLVGIKVLEKHIPRKGYKIFDGTGASRIGEVTSGTLSPSLNFPIAIGYVKEGLHKVGTKLKLEVRGTKIPAEIISTPFYRSKSI